MFSRRKSFDYFAGFHEFSKFSLEAAEFLNEIVTNFDIANLEEQQVKMHEIESNCDKHKHAIDAELFREFLPPIAAEDIVELNSRLDSVVDAIEDILIGMYTFNVKNVRPQAVVFSEIIVELSHALFEATKEFQDFKKSKLIINKLRKIKELELDADEIYIEEMHRLHVEEENCKKLLIWTRVYDSFEDCADSFEEVAKQMEAIIIKNT
ncbi:MAG: DUF47 family protein [Erysipelothrix sp.]|nr:DUF47 family protein [Erysipelothrix sp.]